MTMMAKFSYDPMVPQMGWKDYETARRCDAAHYHPIIVQRYLQFSANAGYLPAKVAIASLLMRGEYLLIDDFDSCNRYQDERKAFSILLSIVKSNIPIEEMDRTILFFVARCYYDGIGCNQDVSIAKYYLHYAGMGQSLDKFTSAEVSMFGNISDDMRKYYRESVSPNNKIA